MTINKLLIANRGEIAIRIARAAADLAIDTVAIYSEDDAASLHTRKADHSVELTGQGAAAYLDIEQIVGKAKELGCDAIHPGYGFLSENPALARACDEAGIRFVGPSAETLSRFGDKAEARKLAREIGVPVIQGTDGPTSLDEATSFFEGLGNGAAMMIKALSGGGGRGMRAVSNADEIAQAYERCQSEAASAFGNGDVYVEQYIPKARHIEVQIAGDGTGNVLHFGERDCSIQRQQQKIVEIAPAPNFDSSLRQQIIQAACQMAESVGYSSLGTFEFLVDVSGAGNAFAFIEANARLQVEHTITEEVADVDLVGLQLELAGGKTFSDLNIMQNDVVPNNGFAIQSRINMERMAADGTARPAGGTITAFDVPSGRGVRVDAYGYAGYGSNPRFDSLLAKLITHTSRNDFGVAVSKAYRALQETRIEGVPTNAAFLMSLLDHPDVKAGRIYTKFVDDHAEALIAQQETQKTPLHFSSAPMAGDAPSRRAGAAIDNSDPLAVLAHGKDGEAPSMVQPSVPAPMASSDISGPANSEAIAAPLQGTIVSVDVGVDQEVYAGQQLLVMEAMKMEHVISAERSGIIREVTVSPGDTVFEEHPLVFIEEADVDVSGGDTQKEVDLDHIRPDLQEVLDRHAKGYDENRPNAVARRRKTNQRTARENIDDLCDPDSFVEYAPIVIAAQRRRREIDDLIDNTPADGMISGVGSVNGDLFGEKESQCAVLSYDYTVLAGTQGLQNHRKKDRMFELARKSELPTVFFTEGGGGRPGDTDGLGAAGLDCLAFQYFAELSGLVPLVGINSGRCFAGNAALLGCCDVIIATENSNIGMGGPAMIEGGGLGIYRPEEVGPLSVQVPNGVVDIPVADEIEAVATAKKYLSYFQGNLSTGDCADQRMLRSVIPENRLRIYDVRKVIETLADTDSVLEIRKSFGLGMITAFARIDGRPVGIVANNPNHLAGAIDSDGADKATRFMQLCDAHDIPLLFLADTPGIMVGPEVEKTALVRHAARMFVTSASVSVPFFTIVLRKGYGLGAQAMAGGGFKATMFTVAWPTGEFGGMGLEGAVKLGYRKELEAIEDPAERKALFDKMVARMYAHGKAVNTASVFEIDDVIDPADSRKWILGALRSAPAPAPRTGKKRPCIDTW